MTHLRRVLQFGQPGRAATRCGVPLFSTDGSRIYFIGFHEDGSRGVWWMPADGGDATKTVAFDDPRLIIHGFLTVGAENLYLTLADRVESDIWVMDLEW